jgi:putative MATE family efflux protein
MRLSTKYKDIFALSFPIMLGSAAQNVIVLSDNIFLFHYDHLQFAAAGIIGAFYLILSAIGYGFSRGGQIFIARKYGEQDHQNIGVYFQSLFIFEVLLALCIFFTMRVYGKDILSLFISSKEILEHSNDFLQIRIYGVFFSYIGLSMIALYTGISKTKIILYDTILLTIVNFVLNYVFIFGKLGFEEMGIKGAALGSTIAEVVAFIFFLVYMVFSKEIKKYHILDFTHISFKKVKDCFTVSFPIVLQSVLGLGSYFLFFSFIENNSSKDLEISNLMRNIYLILSIPTWGFSAGINTLVSTFIGNRKRQAVVPIILKTAFLSLIIATIVTLPVILYPNTILYPLFGSEENNLISENKEALILLLPIMTLFSVGSIFINGLTGTGHTKSALGIQTVFTMLYILYCLIFIKYLKLSLFWAWGSEIVYWLGIMIVSLFYLKSKKWHENIIK